MAAFGGWEIVGRVAQEEVGEWLAAERAGAYREPARRALLWRFRPSRLAIPAFDAEWVATTLHEGGWIAQRVEPPIFQRVLEVHHGEPLGYALEWIEAVPLRRLLAERGPLPPQAAIAAVVTLCEAVAALHAQRAEDGTPLSILARCLDLDSMWVSADGALRVANPVVVARMGFRPPDERLDPPRIDFLPPEIARGEPAQPESDVFQLGLVALALRLGRSPLLRESTFETLCAARDVELAPADWARVPEALRPILMRALERAPDERPPSPRELATQLLDAAAASGMGIAAPDAALARHVLGLPAEPCGVRAGVPRELFEAQLRP